MRSETIGNIAKALSNAQAKLEAANFDSTNPFLKNRYASLGAVTQAIQPVLKDNGLAYSQIVNGDGSFISVDTILMHESGEWLQSHISMPLGEERGKSLAQAAGGIITYLRRYSLASMFGVYAEEDDDGNKPEKPAQPKPAQQKPAQPEKPEKPVTGGIEYPAELAIVTNSEGVPYVTIATDQLTYMLNAMTKASKTETDQEKLSRYSMKSQAIKEILALRNGG